MPVLGTKLRRPSPRRQLVQRPRLVERLQADGTTAPRLILVAAPAGFGKTTVLTQWLASMESPDCTVAWLALDSADAELTRFLTNLVASAHQAIESVGAEALALVEAGATPSGQAVMVSLINDLDTFAGPTVLALDDYHVVDDPAVHQAMAFLLDNLPPHVTVAMTTRSDPPLPLARLRARGELVELRARDLRFTADESADFLNDVMGLDLEPAHVAALGARTEGWAAGLQLAALSARTHAGSGSSDVAAFVEAFSGSNRFILDYLVEEVVDRQPEDVRAFLLATCVAESLTGGLADALAGRSGGQAMLESLERANVLVVPLDDERLWFRYHHLFADALRARLQASSPHDVSELHGRASRWLAEHGLLADAVRHSIASGDHERTADLVEVGIADLRRRRENRRLRDWLEAIPDAVARRRPLIATHRGWLRLTEGDLDGVERWLDIAEAGLATSTPAIISGVADLEGDRAAELRSLPAMLEIYRASVAQARGDVDGTVAHARAAYELAGADDHFARGAAAGFLGLAAWAAGDLATAVDTFSEAVTSLRAAGMVADELGGSVVLAGMWMARGNPMEARRLCERAIDAAAAHTSAVLPTTGDVHVALAQVLCELGELDGAAAHLEIARELGDLGSLAENRHRWFTTMAALLRTRGDLEGAVEMLDRAEPLFLHGFFPDVRPIAATRTRVRIAQGRLADAWSWARDRGVTAERTASYLVEYEQLTLARLLSADGDTGRALEVIDAVIDDATGARRAGSLIEARLLRALVLDARGDADAAIADLTVAVAYGVPAGFARVFLDEGQPMVDLLERLVVGGPGPIRDLAEQLLSGARRTPLPAAPRQVGPDALSERELDVLRLLGSDLSGPEIARALFVSVNTLRTHSKRIFTKLDVNTRRAAVSRATALGLL